MLAERYLKNERGRVGPQTLQRWAGYSGFAYDSGTVVGPDGKPVTTKPDFSTWFTNQYLAPAG
jgi:hypothetical protein